MRSTGAQVGTDKAIERARSMGSNLVCELLSRCDSEMSAMSVGEVDGVMSKR